MGKQLPDHVRQRIINLKNENLGVTEIKKRLKSEGYNVGRSAIYRLFQKWAKHHSIANLPRKPKSPINVTNSILDFIDTCMEKNDELTANKLGQLLLQQFNVSFSTSKIKRLRHGLGWYSTGTKYCQLVREVNRQKRLIFAKKVQEMEDDFGNVLWTDESCIQMDWNGKVSFHRWWEPAKLKGKPKHPFKLNVWGCISKRGASPILIFNGIMDKEFYSEEILKITLKPFISDVCMYPKTHQFESVASNAGKSNKLVENPA